MNATQIQKQAREIFVENLKDVALKTDNKNERKYAISMIETYGNIEEIDLGCDTYVRGCK